MTSPIQPFGEICFENEIELLGDRWDEYFFEQTRFVIEALLEQTYLIVGRRGSGKSSIVEHFAHQHKYPNSHYIRIGDGEHYNTEFYEIAQRMNFSAALATQRLVELWDFYIWQLIFKKLVPLNPIFRNALAVQHDDFNFSNIIKKVFTETLRQTALISADAAMDMITAKMKEPKIKAAKEEVLKISQTQPIFIAIDSRERYEIRNDFEMWITAALVQCASNFNVYHARQGIHLKVCIADEVFPYLKEHHVTNTLKHIRNPLYLYWRPKDLIRLICWRFFKYLKINGMAPLRESDVKWDSFREIYQKLWAPYFGESITNRRGLQERTLPYVLRHTHLRPRQLIITCNAIAHEAIIRGEFPKMSPKAIQLGILNCEIDLADELINSYNSIYPKIGDIIMALNGMPIRFKGSDLDRIAPRTAAQWAAGDYSPDEFKKLVTELGIVGRVRETSANSPIIKADFEFAMRNRLYLTEKDECVIHPMFYDKLHINRTLPTNDCVYPFPDSPDFEEMELS